MNDNVFNSLRQDVEKKNVRHGEISITLKFHDGRIDFYTLTTTERKNCNTATEKKIEGGNK